MPHLLTCYGIGAPSRFVALLALLLSLEALAQRAHAEDKPGKATDVLVFTNGDQLTGTLVGTVGDRVTFKSEMAGEINVPLAKIKELRSGSQFAVLRKDQQPRYARRPGRSRSRTEGSR